MKEQSEFKLTELPPRKLEEHSGMVLVTFSDSTKVVRCAKDFAPLDYVWKALPNIIVS